MNYSETVGVRLKGDKKISSTRQFYNERRFGWLVDTTFVRMNLILTTMHSDLDKKQHFRINI